MPWACKGLQVPTAPTLGPGHNGGSGVGAPRGGSRVVLMGVGVPGLVWGLRVGMRGLQVTLLEAAEQPGGKMRQLMVDGGAIDSGPTVFTMRWVFEQVYGSVGASLEDELQLSALPILARHAWGSDQRMDLFADPGQSRDAIARLAGPCEGTRFMGFFQHARYV